MVLLDAMVQQVLHAYAMVIVVHLIAVGAVQAIKFYTHN